jgi:hypothetical protein
MEITGWIFQACGNFIYDAGSDPLSIDERQMRFSGILSVGLSGLRKLACCYWRAR